MVYIGHFSNYQLSQTFLGLSDEGAHALCPMLVNLTDDVAGFERIKQRIAEDMSTIFKNTTTLFKLESPSDSEVSSSTDEREWSVVEELNETYLSIYRRPIVVLLRNWSAR